MHTDEPRYNILRLTSRLPLLAIWLLLLFVTPGYTNRFPHPIAGAAEVPGLVLASAETEQAFPNLPSFTRMVHLTHAGDGTNRLWLVLQEGRIVVFPNVSIVSSTDTFLDIQEKVISPRGDEEGLLGLAFDPDYPLNGYFYVYYSAGNPRRSVISRFSVSATNPNQADAQSELVILEVAQPFSNHNGGTIAFGADGYLYIALGDGGDGGDPLNHGQNKATLLGSILRIDVSDAQPTERYRIPADNPFVGAADGSLGEIWAYGLRNPWKFSFDSATGAMWAGDVGQNSFEEIDIVRSGRNYGWKIMEGFHCFPPTLGTCNQAGLELPVIEYDHDEGCSVTGGYVYRGTRLANLVGTYIYGDYCSGRIWGLNYNGNAVTEHALLVDTDFSIPAFGTDQDKEIYILSFDGSIYRFVAQADTTAPIWPAGSALGISNIQARSLTLTWPGAGDNLGVTAYRIYLDSILLATVSENTLSYNVTGLTPGVEYPFKVQAGDAAGNFSSDGPSARATAAFVAVAVPSIGVWGVTGGTTVILLIILIRVYLGHRGRVGKVG